VFRGQHEHAIDAKGRTSVPAKFRELLAAQGQEKLVLTHGVDPCLVAYPMTEWLAFEERLARLPQFDASVAMIRRLYVSGAVEIELDKLGRLVIPKELRDVAGLEREVLWAGMGKQIELWAKGRFDGLRRAVLDDDKKRADIAARLAELGL
jgi:MraZ protein